MNSPSPISSETSLTAITSLPKTLVTPSRTILAMGRPPRGAQVFRLSRSMGQAPPGTPVRRRTRLQAIEAQERSADHGRIGEDLDHGRRSDSGEALLDPIEERRIVGSEDAASQHDVHVELGHPQALDRGARHDHDLVGLAVDDVARHGVARDGLGEHEWRELDEPAGLEPVEVHRLEELTGSSVAEVRRHGGSEVCARSSAVLRANREPGGHPSDVGAAAPVAGDLTDGREPGDCGRRGPRPSSSCRSRRRRRRPNAGRCRHAAPRTCRCAPCPVR